MTRIELCEGKYVFYTSESGVLYCNRHREPWRDFLGDKAVHALFDKCVELAQAAAKPVAPSLVIKLTIDGKMVYEGTAEQALLSAHFGGGMFQYPNNYIGAVTLEFSEKRRVEDGTTKI